MNNAIFRNHEHYNENKITRRRASHPFVFSYNIMDVRGVQLVLFVSLVFAAGADALSGHTKTFWNETTENVLQCVDLDINCDVMKQNLACCRHEVVPLLHYDEITTCAEGWLEDSNESCSIAACRHCPVNTFCLSNGTCAHFCEVNSNKTATCVCSPGLKTAPYCNIFKRKMTPIVVLEKINRADKKILSKIRLYNERAWTNRNGFNRITVMVPHIYFPDVISSLHKIYKEQYNSAIVSFSKHESSQIHDSLRRLHTECGGNRTTQTYICTLSAFDRYIDHGDTMNIDTDSTISFSSPHYTLSNLINRTQTFRASMAIGFDFQPPVHCTKNCSLQPLEVSPEISKGRIHIEWNGWEDGLSGIKHYILSVYKMTPNQAGDLSQPDDSCFSNTTDRTSTYYLPSQPGVYAFLLIVEDNASNRNYARRFALYDSTSRIDINKTNKLYFSSASEESNYHWQSNNTYISVSWEDHFVNYIHDKGKFLSQIVTDPVVIDNSTVILTYDDREGKIKLTATPNARGIIRFEYVGPLAADPKDGKPDTESWRGLGQIAHESLHKGFTTARGDGSSDKVWIKAHDVMGHTAVDSTYVYFDSSPPTAYGDKAILQKNIHSRKFTSRVIMEATDKDSGIYQIQWDVQDKVTGRILTSGFTAGNRTEDKADCDSNIKECRCVADGACYLFKHYLYIDHCPIQMSNTDLQIADLVLNIRVVNYALLTHNFTMKIGKATTLNGIKQCE
ncbi:hypothetical protein KP79_PYT19846 [Mizuhopecten yessoensis]|uniref:Uncharacterized protein n=1 Tax=Mizuhopecten yessoensis TaxID=6573 RepID=A0A210PSL7_MIZYE|nr:hypothetical protein KP79_PYT19846 [Mizuhopecten yessoensis]